MVRRISLHSACNLPTWDRAALYAAGVLTWQFSFDTVGRGMVGPGRMAGADPEPRNRGTGSLNVGQEI